MRDIWVISDTHLFHENILKFKDSSGNLIRPGFSDVDEMNLYILEQWNSVVKPGDIVYHLGDVFMGDKDEFKKLWPKFNGRKRLVVGNHDDIRFLGSGGFFQKILMWRQFTELGLLLSHVPIHHSSLVRNDKELHCVHGHVHQNDSPPGPYTNVSVEKIKYTPVHIESLTQWNT